MCSSRWQWNGKRLCRVWWKRLTQCRCRHASCQRWRKCCRHRVWRSCIRLFLSSRVVWRRWWIQLGMRKSCQWESLCKIFVWRLLTFATCSISLPFLKCGIINGNDSNVPLSKAGTCTIGYTPGSYILAEIHCQLAKYLTNPFCPKKVVCMLPACDSVP